MGIEYYLCDDENKELFRLGKGGTNSAWELIFPYELETPFKLSKVLNKLKTRIESHVEWDKDPDYQSWLYWKLVDWIQMRTISLISEVSPHGDEILYNNWVHDNYPKENGLFDEELGFYNIVDDRYEESE